MENQEELTKMENKTESADCAKQAKSPQQCVVENKKAGSLNAGNRDLGSDDVRHTVYTCGIIACTNQNF